MTQTIESFPSLKRAALAIARDNGQIYRDYTEEQYLRSLDPILGAEGVYYDDIRQFDQWLSELSDEDLETLCAGEQTEQEAVWAKAPSPELARKWDGLLNDIFEQGGQE